MENYLRAFMHLARNQFAGGTKTWREIERMLTGNTGCDKNQILRLRLERQIILAPFLKNDLRSIVLAVADVAAAAAAKRPVKPLLVIISLPSHRRDRILSLMILMISQQQRHRQLYALD
jgi:hypothetical protein